MCCTRVRVHSVLAEAHAPSVAGRGAGCSCPAGCSARVAFGGTAEGHTVRAGRASAAKCSPHVPHGLSPFSYHHSLMPRHTTAMQEMPFKDTVDYPDAKQVRQAHSTKGLTAGVPLLSATVTTSDCASKHVSALLPCSLAPWAAAVGPHHINMCCLHYVVC